MVNAFKVTKLISKKYINVTLTYTLYYGCP